jgi:hypothetical protein
VKPGTPIITLQPGQQSDAKVFVIAQKAPDGSMTATRMAVGKDGLTPPIWTLHFELRVRRQNAQSAFRPIFLARQPLFALQMRTGQLRQHLDWSVQVTTTYATSEAFSFYT